MTEQEACGIVLVFALLMGACIGSLVGCHKYGNAAPHPKTRWSSRTRRDYDQGW